MLFPKHTASPSEFTKLYDVEGYPEESVARIMDATAMRLFVDYDVADLHVGRDTVAMEVYCTGRSPEYMTGSLDLISRIADEIDKLLQFRFSKSGQEAQH